MEFLSLADMRIDRSSSPFLVKAKAWGRGSMIIMALMATVGCRPSSSNTPIQNKGISKLEPTVEKADPEGSTALNEPAASNAVDSPISRAEDRPTETKACPSFRKVTSQRYHPPIPRRSSSRAKRERRANNSASNEEENGHLHRSKKRERDGRHLETVRTIARRRTEVG